jgi:hypothetical protein
MPTICRFYGIVIFMNYNDHQPPHFHARYQEYEVTVEIASGITEGRMPARALQLVYTWHQEHRAELMDNWDRARARLPLLPIAPIV